MIKIPKGFEKTVKKSDLQRGIKVELEHTTSKKKAKHIALQHLVEFRKYYDIKVGVPALEKRLRKYKQ